MAAPSHQPLIPAGAALELYSHNIKQDPVCGW